MGEALSACARLIRAAAILALLFVGAPLAAATDGLVPATCFTVSDRPVADAANCGARPTDYSDRWLWLHADAPEGREWRATVRHSRFGALVVLFRYADGVEERQSVKAGDFGRHWRIGGKVAFDPPLRHAKLVSVHFGFHKLASHELLRVRLVPTEVADRTQNIATLLAGAALALLGFSAAYNLGVGAGARRRAVLWHAAWAACVFGWGLLWTQVILFVAPGMAGPAAVQASILLAAAAIACAAQFFVTSVEPGMLPRWLSLTLSSMAATIMLLGAAASFSTGGLLSLVAQLLSLGVLASAAAFVGAVVVAWRRGSRMSRDFALSWAVPILAVVWTVFSEHGLTSDDDSGQLMVLAVCALQTVGLSLIVSHRLASVRRERRESREREAALRMLADTDPLTGLLNRRGFVARIEAALGTDRSVGLILADLDHFKTVNDRFGHDAGDRLLSAVAETLLEQAEGATVGRLGGEEFGIGIVGLPAAALVRLAERLRRAVAGVAIAEGATLVSASFGIAVGGESFEALYRSADKALYGAKALGRNRVAVAEPEPPLAMVS